MSNQNPNGRLLIALMVSAIIVGLFFAWTLFAAKAHSQENTLAELKAQQQTDMQSVEQLLKQYNKQRAMLITRINVGAGMIKDREGLLKIKGVSEALKKHSQKALKAEKKAAKKEKKAP